jgi:SAM-dependent methyltransferase
MELAGISSARFDVLVADSVEAEICNKRITESGLADRFTIHIGSSDSLPFADTTFVLVLAREAMRFWQTSEKTYREINRVLKNQGTAILGAGLGTAIEHNRAQRLWGTVQQWRANTGRDPWAATKPVPDEIEQTLLTAGIDNYSMTVEGDCTCRTVIQWQKNTAASGKP